jgi:hypothetical protein
LRDAPAKKASGLFFAIEHQGAAGNRLKKSPDTFFAAARGPSGMDTSFPARLGGLLRWFEADRSAAPADDASAVGAESWWLATAPRRFCGVFLAAFLLGVGALAALNWAVDPYAQYGTGWFPPVVLTSRAEKLALLDAFGPPEALLLGSSRVMKFEPEYVHAQTGLRCFNASVYYGRCEDFLALLRASRTRFGSWPQLVIVGLDVDAFVERPGPDARLLRNNRLRSEIPELLPWGARWGAVRELWSWDQTKQSLGSLRRGAEIARWQADEESFAPDGLIEYHRRERERAAGTYDFAGPLDYTQREYRRLYAGYQRLDPMRVRAWQELAELCRHEGVELAAFLTTWHPEMASMQRDVGTFAARRDEVAALVRGALGSGGAFVDFTDVAAFDGDPAEFVDGVHPLESNTRRMIDVLLPALRGTDPEVRIAL